MDSDEKWHLLPTYSTGSHRSYFVECFATVPATGEVCRAGTGTAFTVRYKDRRYIVTNRHVVTGKDSKNQDLDKEFPLPPERIRFNVPLFEPQDMRHSYDIQVLGSENQPQFWWQHPTLGPAVDIAVLPMYDHLHSDFQAKLAMELGGELITMDYLLEDFSPYRHPIPLRVTQELYVVGYPFYADPTKTSNAAVWTRGTIASEPHRGFNGTEAFLIDARTRKGQSGSPVVRHDIVGSSPESRRFPEFEAHMDTLVGVYSGRIHDNLDIGFVWPSCLIREVIEGEYTPTYRDLLPLD